MRVALIDPSLFTLPYDVALAEGLSRNGQSVTLYGRSATASDGNFGQVAFQPCFYTGLSSSVAGRLPKKLRPVLKGADHPASMLRLIRRFGATRPDIIHFQWLPLPLLDRLLLPAFRRVAPVILTVHDTDPFNGNPTARLQSFGFVAALKSCDHLIVHTSQGFERLVAKGISSAKISVLPHGPLTAMMAPSEADPMTGTLSFVLFGKIKPYKGADLLIEAFASLPPRLQAQAQIRIIGQAYMDLAPLRARIAEHGLAERIVLEDRFVEESELPSIFAESTVAVFPYREIEASGVLSLALAHGRPIIASRLGSFAETITDGVQGRLLPPGDVPALACSMAALIENRILAASYAQQALHLANQLPSWEHIADLTVSLYRAAIGAPVRDAAAPARRAEQVTP